MIYYNPSRTARIWDPRNNKHWEPGEKSEQVPDSRLTRAGKLLCLNSSETASYMPAEPVVVTGAMVLEDEEDGSDNEPIEEQPVASRKKKVRY